MYLNIPKIIRFLPLILTALLLASCSPAEDQAAITLEEQEAQEEIEEQVPSIEVEDRQPIFVYGNQSTKPSEEVTLRINAEPLLLSSKYMRLVGVVSGGNARVLVEVGGRGLCVGIGEKIGEYEVVRISGRGVQLRKGGEK